MRQFVDFASMFVALAVSMLALFLTVGQLPEHPQALKSILATVAIAAAIGQVGGRLLLAMAIVALFRGRKAIGWVPLSRCTTVSGWCGFEWNHFSRGAQQVGMRLFGFEIAFSGDLGEPAPSAA